MERELTFIEEILRKSGEVAKEHFNAFHIVTTKDAHQIVTEVDLASEQLLINAIQKTYPTDAIIAEESGHLHGKSSYTWIIDPIDGTSNYAVSLPWYGIMVARLENWTPKVAGIYLPGTDELFLAAKDHGTFYNGNKIKVADSTILRESLISFCADGKSDQLAFIASLYGKLLQEARNIRSTNSAVDYAYAAIGKLAACINLNNKVWDVAAGMLLAQEAGNTVTDIDGNAIQLSTVEKQLMANFTLVIAHPSIHNELLSCVKNSR
jgi:myo-inositol-1(or 4)-monophosphatase